MTPVAGTPILLYVSNFAYPNRRSFTCHSLYGISYTVHVIKATNIFVSQNDAELQIWRHQLMILHNREIRVKALENIVARSSIGQCLN